jgi:hypothetical protein
MIPLCCLALYWHRVKCCGFVEFRHELRKKMPKKMEIWKRSQNVEFLIIWRFPFPDVIKYNKDTDQLCLWLGLRCPKTCLENQPVEGEALVHLDWKLQTSALTQWFNGNTVMGGWETIVCSKVNSVPSWQFDLFTLKLHVVAQSYIIMDKVLPWMISLMKVLEQHIGSLLAPHWQQTAVHSSWSSSHAKCTILDLFLFPV